MLIYNDILEYPRSMVDGGESAFEQGLKDILNSLVSVGSVLKAILIIEAKLGGGPSFKYKEGVGATISFALGGEAGIMDYTEIAKNGNQIELNNNDPIKQNIENIKNYLTSATDVTSEGSLKGSLLNAKSSSEK